MSMQGAMDILREGAGTQWHPKVVAAAAGLGFEVPVLAGRSVQPA